LDLRKGDLLSFWQMAFTGGDHAFFNGNVFTRTSIFLLLPWRFGADWWRCSKGI
jgi:hypothetical protein